MPFTVVGLMPPGFKGLTDNAELWVPFAQYGPPGQMNNRGSRGFAALARLKPGVTLAMAQAEMDGISRQLERAYPVSNEKRAVEISPLDVELFGSLRRSLLTLMAAVGFVLAIACANVANLQLARSEARRREIAVRTALGAGRGRLIRQMVTESCVLTLIGAAVGLLLARAAVAALIAQSPVTFPSFVAPGLDVRLAAFTIVVSLACGVLVGLAPGLQAHDLDVNAALKESSRGSDGRRSQRMRSGLVVVEVSLAVVLLIGAGLMIRSVRNLIALDPGFDPDSVLTKRVSIPRMAPQSGVPAAPAAPAATAPGEGRHRRSSKAARCSIGCDRFPG
jgi:putative ABC transport system permease protein